MNKNPKIRPALAVLLTSGFGLAALIFGLIFGGAAAASEFADPGPLVRLGLPVAKFFMNTGMAIAAGGLAFGAFALADKSPALNRVLNLSAFGALVWSLGGAANFLLTYLSVTGSSVSFDQTFSDQLWMFATDIELGVALAINLAAAATLTILILAVRSLTGTLLLAALAMAGLVPLALIGHSAGTANHSLAVNAMGMHLVGIVVWVGGLIALFSIRKISDDSQGEIAKRYSTLALISFVLVAISGVTSSFVRLENNLDFSSPYLQLILLKVAALFALGIFGAVYRSRLVGNLVGPRFYKLVAVEFAIMGSAIGLGTALARTAPPITEEFYTDPTPAEILTGEKLPPELTAIQFLTVWKIDIAWLAISLFAIGLYIAGVIRLSRRGDKWHPSRTASWVAGHLVLIYVTSGAINAYQEYLFSIHMIGHMILAMGIPVLLVVGAPITLISRAVEKRKDGSRGLREWALWAVHTKYAQFIAHPLVAAVLFASSLVTFYYTPLFAWATSEHLGHQWMVVHFLITGYLFAQALVGIDPGPNRLPFAARLLLLIGTMAFHAFFGLGLMSEKGLLLPQWFGAMGRTWGETPLADQQTGGAIAWGIGEIPTAMLVIIVAVQWYKSDQRESKRLDRASDRIGNQDLNDYNEMLSKLAERDQRGGGR